MKKTAFATIADILAIVGFGLAMFTAFRVFPNSDNTGFDYQAILVGVIGGIFTLLVGWNIFQAIDLKNEIRRVDGLKNDVQRELNFIHNKSNYNQALVYAMMSQTTSSHFAPNEEAVLKYNMLLKGVVALKIFSRFPDCENEIKSLMDTMIKGLKNSSHVRLSEKYKTELVLSCGEIANRDKIARFAEFIDLIKE